MDPCSVIGVRTPELRKLAKEIADNPQIGEFLDTLPHVYFEENNLHAFIISEKRDFNECVLMLEGFLPYIDNWATCDQLRPKCFVKEAHRLLPHIERWLMSEHTYTVRYGIGALMSYFLDDRFDARFLDTVSKIRSKEYYVNMMIAWYFATALAKQYETSLPYIEKCVLDKWTHNKAIRKSIESYRITDEQKKHLRALKAK